MEIQVLINGLISGLAVAVLALAFSLVYLPCRVFHVAMGGIYALVPFVALSVLRHQPSWAMALGAGIGTGIVISLLCESLNHSRLERRQASGGAHLISSLGIFIVLVEIVAISWGNETQVLRVGIDRVFRMGSITLTRAQVFTGLISLLLLGGIYGGLRFSQLGLRLRALADNSIEFGLRGFNVNAYRLMAFAVSGLLVSSAALMTAYDVGFDPHGGLHMLVLAVVAVLIGGRESFMGPVLGGLLLGVLRALVVWYLSARWQDVATFLLLAVFLYVKPHGICGRAGRLEADA